MARRPFGARDGIEVVVDRDAAHAHHVADRLDGLAQQERAPLVEQPHRGLLLLTRQLGERRAELFFDRRDHLPERVVEIAETSRRRRPAEPHLHRRGAVGECGAAHVVHSCRDRVDRTDDRGRERSEIGLEPMAPARLERRVDVWAEGPLDERFDQKLGANGIGAHPATVVLALTIC